MLSARLCMIGNTPAQSTRRSLLPKRRIPHRPPLPHGFRTLLSSTTFTENHHARLSLDVVKQFHTVTRVSTVVELGYGLCGPPVTVVKKAVIKTASDQEIVPPARADLLDKIR